MLPAGRSYQPHCAPDGQAFNRNEYQESSGDEGWPARKTDNLTAVCVSVV
jgi:hypothetical protein